MKFFNRNLKKYRVTQLRIDRIVGQYFTHSHFGCVPSEIKTQALISPAECETVRQTGTFHHSEFTLRDIVTNKHTHHSYYSHGNRDNDANCATTNFIRSGIEFKNSYELTTVKVTFTSHARKTEPGLVTRGEEILLGHGIRMPASKQSFEDARFGTVIWNYEPPSCSSLGSLRAYQQIYMGDADVRICNDATSQNKYEGSILTVVPADQAGVLPKTFGLALHHKTRVCDHPVYQSNIEDVVILILGNSKDHGVPINHNIALSQSHLTSFKTVASRWFVEANNRVDDLSQTFYEETCKLERQTIMNYQRILRMATSSTSLAPYFNEGFTAIRTGGVASVIHCQAEQAEINLQQEGCWDQLPVYRLDEGGKPFNETWFANPVTKVLTPTGTRVDCSSRYPQMYRLSGGTYVCQSGSGITRCAKPTILMPGTADLHDSLTNQFHKLMGTGIYTKAEQQQIDFRFHEQQYEDHLRSEQTYTANMCIKSTVKVQWNHCTLS